MTAIDVKNRALQGVSLNLPALPKKISSHVSSEATRVLAMLRDLDVSHVYRARLFLLREVIVFFTIHASLFVNIPQDNTLSSMPTAEWQDRLAARLSRNVLDDPHSTGTGTQQSASRAFGEAPLPRRRRLDGSSPTADLSQPNWNDMYTMEASSGNLTFLILSKIIQLKSCVSDSAETDESQCATAFGQLSLDENQEVGCASIDVLVYSPNPVPVSWESLWTPPPHWKRSRR